MRGHMFCPSRTLIRDNLLVESSCLEPHQSSSPVGWDDKSQSKKGTTVSRQADLCFDPITKACRGLELEPTAQEEGRRRSRRRRLSVMAKGMRSTQPKHCWLTRPKAGTRGGARKERQLAERGGRKTLSDVVNHPAGQEGAHQRQWKSKQGPGSWGSLGVFQEN